MLKLRALLPLTALFGVAILFQNCQNGFSSYQSASVGSTVPVLGDPALTFPVPAGPGILTRAFGNTIAASENFCVNGAVQRIAPAGTDRMILAGQFSYFGKCGGYNMLLENGAMKPMPVANARINAVIADGNGGWFIGGGFTSVGGVAASRIAHILANGTVVAFDVVPVTGVNGIRSLALSPNKSVLYVTGDFTMIGTATRNNGIAAYDVASHSLSSWDSARESLIIVANTVVATDTGVYIGGTFGMRAFTSADGTALPGFALPSFADGAVIKLALGNGRIYIGGSFFSVNGLARVGVASVDLATGTLNDWKPLLSFSVGNGNSPTVYALTVDGNNVYLGGRFTVIDGQTVKNVAVVDATTGVFKPLNVGLSDIVISIAVANNVVYVTGSMLGADGTRASGMVMADAKTGNAINAEAGWFGSETVTATDGARILFGSGSILLGPGWVRNNLAAIDVASGQLTNWDPNVAGSINALHVDGDRVIIGGTFQKIGALIRRGTAMINDRGLALDWAPGVQALSFAQFGRVLYVAGPFSQVLGQTRSQVAAFNLDTLALLPLSLPISFGGVLSLATDGPRLYAGGNALQVNNINSINDGFFVFDSATGAVIPSPRTNRAVTVVKVSGTRLFLGGYFTSVDTLARSGLAELDTTNLAISPLSAPLDPAGIQDFTFVGGTILIGGNGRTGPLGNLVALPAASAPVGIASIGPEHTISALVPTASGVFVGGSFNTINPAGVTRAGFMILDPATLRPR